MAAPRIECRRRRADAAEAKGPARPEPRRAPASGPWGTEAERRGACPAAWLQPALAFIRPPAAVLAGVRRRSPAPKSGASGWARARRPAP